jgi:hypothetical protein
VEIPEDTTHRLEPVRLPKDKSEYPRWRQKVPLDTLIKLGMVLKYKEGKGSHHSAKKKPSRRDEIRQWLADHPEANQNLNLRKKTGRVSGYDGPKPKPKKEKEIEPEA